VRRQWSIQRKLGLLYQACENTVPVEESTLIKLQGFRGILEGAHQSKSVEEKRQAEGRQTNA
jgi:hypothetical protein